MASKGDSVNPNVPYPVRTTSAPATAQTRIKRTQPQQPQQPQPVQQPSGTRSPAPAAKQVTPSTTPIPEEEPRESPTTVGRVSPKPSPAKEAHVPLESELATRVYSRETMLSRVSTEIIKKARTTNVFQWADAELYTNSMCRPEHMILQRAGFFAEGSGRTHNIRKLADQVRGILGKVTPQKYEAVKEELLNLPIRQSTDADIEEVVATFFKKAITREDSLFLDLYVRLIVDLLEDVKRKEEEKKKRDKEREGKEGGEAAERSVADIIRRQLIDHCQKTFEEPLSVSNEELEGLSDEEREIKNRMLKDKLNANLCLLGTLFVRNLVREKVVNSVMYLLLFGREENRRHNKNKPQPHEIEMFCTLFRKVGPNQGPKLKESFPAFIDSMKELMRTFPDKRVCILLQNCVELYERNWEETKTIARPMTFEEQNKAVFEKTNQENDLIDRHLAGDIPPPAASSPFRVEGKTPVTASAPKLPPVETVNQVFEAFMKDHVLTDAVSFFNGIPTEKRGEYVFHWVRRVLVTVKLQNERDLVGELLKGLVDEKLFEEKAIQSVIQQVITDVVLHIDDHPRLAELWTSMIEKNLYLGMDLHTCFIYELLLADVEPSLVVKFFVKIGASSHVYRMTRRSANDVPRRFRVLPTILKFKADLLDIKEIPDDEVTFFRLLCGRASPKELCSAFSKNPNRSEAGFVVKVVCAVISFVRFDCSCRELERCLPLLQAMVKLCGDQQEGNDIENLILVETHLTWADLDRTPETAFSRTVEWLATKRVITERGLLNFKTYLAKNSSPDDKQLDNIGFKNGGGA